MSLDKAVEHGKEHRRPYYRSERFDRTCRPHGGRGKKHDAGQCPWCLENRMYQEKKALQKVEAMKKEYEESEE